MQRGPVVFHSLNRKLLFVYLFMAMFWDHPGLLHVETSSKSSAQKRAGVSYMINDTDSVIY